MSAVARQVSEFLKRRLGERKHDMWFGPSTRFRIAGNRLEISAESPHIAEWIGSHFGDDLREAAKKALGEAAVVDVRVQQPGKASVSRNGPLRKGRSRRGEHETVAAPPEPQKRGRSVRSRANGATARVAPASSTTRPTSSRIARAANRRLDLHLPLRHRFEDFVVGPSNQLAYTSAIRMADESEVRSIGALFIHGECGLGKTHLLQSVCARHLERYPGAVVRYTTGEQFTNEYIVALKSNTLEQFRQRVRSLDLLGIDDIHFLANKTATQSEFLHTLDAIDLGGARIVMASDEHPRHLRSVSRALVSRFLAGMVVEIERPGRELRLQLVKRLADRRGLRLNAQAMELIAANCVASVREIEGALNKLVALTQFGGDVPSPSGEVGCVLVERLFKVESQNGKPLRIGEIIDVVCQRLGIERTDLLSTTRHRRVVLARGVVSHLSRELTTLSYPEIGRALGRRNHSTVLTAGRRLAEQVESNETIELDDGNAALSLREFIDQLRHEIRRSHRG